MDQEEYGVDPFSSEGLWRLSKFTLEALPSLDIFAWNAELPDQNRELPQSAFGLFEQDFSTLPQLDVLDGNILLPGQLLESVTDTFSDTEIDEILDSQDDDRSDANSSTIWKLESLDLDLITEVPLRSWERFHDRSSREPPSAYFSESGANGFDAALLRQANSDGHKESGRIARNDVFFHAMFRLGLGWSSIFFRYNRQQRKFERVSGGIRISGVSLTAINSVVEQLLQCGTDMQRIREFARRTRVKSREFSARSAFSSTIAAIVYTLEKRLSGYSRGISSLLQITSLFERCGELVHALATIVEAVEKAVSDAQVISVIIKKAAHFAQTLSSMENLFREIVARAITPWLHYVEAWVGLRAETPGLFEATGNSAGFVVTERRDGRSTSKRSRTTTVDYRYHPDQMPSFIPEDQAQLIFESGRGLRLLRRYHPQHPVASGTPLRKDRRPALSCAGTWSDIERIQKKAQFYEAELRSEILKYTRGQTTDNALAASHAQKSDSAVEDRNGPENYEMFDIDDSRNTTGLLTQHSTLNCDELVPLLNTAQPQKSESLESRRSKFGPEMISAIYLSLAPLLSSQALLIDFSCLHLLFKEHRLRYHLTLQWRFQLLGDGHFTSRLSHSLFDPEMESGERRSGVVRSGVHTGLRLGSRDTWPPASSELRLVLMGLLSDCNMDERLDNSGNVEFLKERELPGGLSFAIRDLTDEEITKCKDPNAIEALDFLRLQYKPSAVLETIITQRSLTQYDRLFKHLLRLIRMVSVVKGLIRDSTARSSLSGDTRNLFQRFRIDCQHFILTLSDYSFHIGVGATWRRFQETLSRTEECLEHSDIDGTIEAAHSVSRLRRYHEDTLDQILFALFLSKRHAEVAKLLERIFGTILTFAPLSQMDGANGVRHDNDATVAQLYGSFRKQTSAFVNFLRGVDGGKVSSRSFDSSSTAFASRASPTSVFDHLLARLDMKRYY
ncbi:tubulin gamma complex associated family protein [Aspergillus clavatus NRRL 1]|uniref:Spindle pole body component n=1 Tax=Aspergillus clavatus (strain ATCC 1007 / CBS 513.65 / DSM 816 / NCTC 3887 / NRRL 1 / QM 1276 / 107) TaxID=344612 RepID=A1CPI0_ASPCL|nr:gamma-tubulin complex component GCP6, putative [Aspergillus clavatus NRRL 1]EAW07551.1 gamma-tubulin complex component GCP6, putative [Aspergillus clavatus NRRL 1]